MAMVPSDGNYDGRDGMRSDTDMFLSSAECFIVGRIAAAWPVECRVMGPLTARMREALSLFRVVNRTFDEFGLEKAEPPNEWWDRADDLPGDVIWRECVKHTRSNEFMSTDGVCPGVPIVAMGLSPYEHGTLFVERSDGRICGWRIEPPKSSLYGLLLRRMRPIIGLSPQAWLMLHDGPWQRVLDDWRRLPEFTRALPHTPFMADPPGDVIGSLTTLA
jgi:hypothetical protein